MLPSTKTLLYDTFVRASGLQCSFLRLVSRTNHSFACKTNRIVAGVLQSIETIMLAWSGSQRFKAERSVQVRNVFLLYGGTRVTHRSILLNDSNDRRFISQTCFHCQYYCVSLCVQPLT